ncbi:MAG: WG repeat-containing protein [Prevotella sp.]|nr:WG repeat-containing protein [Prevotella sp.]
MKRIVIWTLALVMGTLYAQAQGAGLSQGQAVKSTTANPTQAKKTCSECGITMGNVTYSWQHETWCPYYRSKNSGGNSASRASGLSTGDAVTAVSAVVVGSAIGNALSNWLTSEPQDKGDYRHYDNKNPGMAMGENTDKSTNKKYPEYVVLKYTKSGKLGIWANAWTYLDEDFVNHTIKKRTDYPGKWILKPKFDYLYLLSPSVAITGVKSGKDAQMKYGLLEFKDGWGYNMSGKELLPNEFTNYIIVNQSGKYKEKLIVAFGGPSKGDNTKWGVWKRVKAEKQEKFKYWDARQMIPQEYSGIRAAKDGYFIAWKDGKCGMFDNDANQVLPFDYVNMGMSQNAERWQLWAQKDVGGKYGVIDIKGNTILPFEYDEISLYDGGTVTFSNKPGKYGALLPDGQRIPMEYDKFYELYYSIYKEKFATVYAEKDEARYYFIDGKAIPTRYMSGTPSADSTYSSWYAKKTADLKETFMKKGEYEKEADYKARISDNTNLTKYISSKISSPLDDYLKPFAKTLTMGKYNAENEYFPLYFADAPWNVVRLHISNDNAPLLKRWYENRGGMKYMREHCTIELVNDVPCITSVIVYPKEDNPPVLYRF